MPRPFTAPPHLAHLAHPDTGPGPTGSTWSTWSPWQFFDPPLLATEYAPSPPGPTGLGTRVHLVHLVHPVRLVHPDLRAQVDPVHLVHLVNLVNLVTLVNLDPRVWIHIVTLVRLVHAVHLEPGLVSTWSSRNGSNNDAKLMPSWFKVRSKIKQTSMQTSLEKNNAKLDVENTSKLLGAKSSPG